jgi:pimeloyl-ACP methyl ester carboxylesterase
MATYALIHGAADSGRYWHLVEAELRDRGHDVVAPDLPCEDDSAGLAEYTDTVVEAIGDRTDLVVVAQSFGGFTAPLVCDRVPAGDPVSCTRWLCRRTRRRSRNRPAAYGPRRSSSRGRRPRPCPG